MKPPTWLSRPLIDRSPVPIRETTSLIQETGWIYKSTKDFEVFKLSLLPQTSQ